LATIARWLFVLCLPVVLITASILAAANSRVLYNYGFDKYAVSETTDLAEEEVDKVARGLIQYFGSNQESISLVVEREGEPFELFNAREVLHLEDVKGLFHLDYMVLPTWCCCGRWATPSLISVSVSSWTGWALAAACPGR